VLEKQSQFAGERILQIAAIKGIANSEAAAAQLGSHAHADRRLEGINRNSRRQIAETAGDLDRLLLQAYSGIACLLDLAAIDI
jgi:hypothetical protein